MKWIGQYIFDFAVRIRNKLYDDSASAGTSDQVLTSTSDGVRWKTLSTLEGSDKHHTHTQNAVSTTWNVVHNLGKYPSVVCVLDNGYEFVPHVEHVDANNLIIYLNGEDRGKAYCN